MAVCRVEKTKNYTVMSNYHLNDPRLSLKAIGLLSKILSLPEAWDYTVAGLAKICKEGRDAVRNWKRRGISSAGRHGTRWATFPTASISSMRPLRIPRRRPRTMGNLRLPRRNPRCRKTRYRKTRRN